MEPSLSMFCYQYAPAVSLFLGENHHRPVKLERGVTAAAITITRSARPAALKAMTPATSTTPGR